MTNSSFSIPTQTTVTCGPPIELSVVRWAKGAFAISSRIDSVIFIYFLLQNLAAMTLAGDQVVILQHFQSASIPPSTGIDAPVMYEAFAEATKTITFAISSGLARRLTGTVETSAALFSSVLVKRVSIPVSVVPGATTFTRTPVPATSSAADFVIPSTACLLATYTDAPAAPTLP